MSSHDPFELPVESPQCRFLCAALNDARVQQDAECRPEFFSGACKFSDEVPEALLESDDHTLPLVTLLRCLWGYRASFVVGKPREDLAPYWNLAQRMAPQWAGFTAERCSPEMADYVNGSVRKHCEQILTDMDRLDAQHSHTSAAT